jgi:hypothetical protein
MLSKAQLVPVQKLQTRREIKTHTNKQNLDRI